LPKKERYKQAPQRSYCRCIKFENKLDNKIHDKLTDNLRRNTEIPDALEKRETVF
jgi:hypothetical protein